MCMNFGKFVSAALCAGVLLCVPVPRAHAEHPVALLMGPDGGFITGSDILMDGGVTAAYWYGELAPQ